MFLFLNQEKSKAMITKLVKMPVRNEFQYEVLPFEQLSKFMNPIQLSLFRSQLLLYKQIMIIYDRKVPENVFKFSKPISFDSSI